MEKMSKEKDESIEKHFAELERCLATSKTSFENDPVHFRERGIFQMAGFIRTFADLMKSLDARLRDDVFAAHELVSTRVKRFMADWDQFLELVEVLKRSVQSLPLGQKFSLKGAFEF